MKPKEMQIDVEVGEQIVKTDLRRDLVISHDLDSEMKYIANNISYYGAMLSLAKKRLAKQELAYKIWRAKENKRLRETGKKMTVADIESSIRVSPTYVTFKMRIISRQEQVDLLESLLKGFQAKKDMIQATAANRRQEMSSMGATSMKSKER